jgi:uncharacterized membrane protein
VVYTGVQRKSWLMKNKLPSYIPALAAGMGAVAGVRSMTAPAVIAWAAKRKVLHLNTSPLVELISANVSDKAIRLALAELVADKLPFTPDRIEPGPLATRILSGAACGAVLSGAADRSLTQGAILGGLGALIGAFGSYHLRRRLSRDMPAFTVALVEDALAIATAAAIVTYVSESV